MGKYPTMKVKIKDLSFQAIIGILPFERQKEQLVVVNCSFKYLYKNDKFINYAEIATFIKELMINKKFELLEDAILTIKKELKKKFKMKKLKLAIAKPTILDDCCVEVKN